MHKLIKFLFIPCFTFAAGINDNTLRYSIDLYQEEAKKYSDKTCLNRYSIDLSQEKVEETFDKTCLRANNNMTAFLSNKNIKYWSNVSVFTSVSNILTPYPVLPSLEFSREIFKNSDSSSRTDLDVSYIALPQFNFGRGDPYTFTPAVEIKFQKFHYFLQESKIHPYFGTGIGLSFPRVIPVYLTLGAMIPFEKNKAYKIEIQASSNPFFIGMLGDPFSGIVAAAISHALKVSTGVTF